MKPENWHGECRISAGLLRRFFPGNLCGISESAPEIFSSGPVLLRLKKEFYGSFPPDGMKEVKMSAYNIAAIQHKNSLIEDLQKRIQQRLDDYQAFAGAVKAGSPANSGQTFSSVLQSLNQASTDNQTSSSGMAAFAAGVGAFFEVLQNGDKSAIQTAITRLQTDIRNALPQNQAETFAVDLKTLREALLADDKAAIRAAFMQLRTDVQSLVRIYIQNHQAGVQSTASSVKTGLHSDLDSLLSAAETQRAGIADAVNTGLQKSVKVMGTLKASPLIGAGIAGLVSVIGNRVNTSA